MKHKLPFPPQIIFFLLLSFKIFGNEFIVKSYKLEDGLPNLRINDGLQDDTGLLWFTADNEIFTYDGINWEGRFLSEKSDDPSYRKLYKDERGGIWALPINWMGRIIYYNGSNWGSLPPIGELAKKNVNQTSIAIKYIEDEIEVYVGTESAGVFLFKNNKWFNISFPGTAELVKANNIKFIDEKLYVASESGFYIYNNKSDKPEFIKLISDNIINFCIDKNYYMKEHDPQIWLLGEGWVGFMQKGKLNILSDKIKLIDNKYKIEVDDEFIFLGAKQQFTFVNKKSGEQEYLDQEEFYYRDGSNSIFVDREKNIWITNNRGIHKIRKSMFDNYPKKGEFLATEVSAIEFFEDGTKLLGHNNGLSLVHDSKTKTIDFIKSLPIKQNHSRILDATLNKNGNILFTSQNYGLGEINVEGRIKWYRLEDETLEFYSVHIDHKGDVWVSAGRSIYKLIDGNLQEDNFFFENDFIRIINSTKDGTLLLGTLMHGVLLYKDGKSKAVTAKLSSANDIFSLYAKTDSEILVGTLDGLYTIKGEKLEKFVENNFSISQPVFFIKPDSDDNLWFGLDNGVIKWDGENYHKYTTNEGLAGPETNRAAGKVDNKGNFWIGTNAGLSNFANDVSSDEIKPIAELLFIETEDGEKHYLNTDLEFNTNIKKAIIHFRALSFINETKNKSKIRLVDLDNDNEKVFYSKSNNIVINEFPQGKSQIFLSVQNSHGVWSNEIKSSKIINPSIPVSLVMIIIYIGIGVIIIYVAIKETNKLLKRSKTSLKKIPDVLENTTNLNPKAVKLKELLESDKIFLDKEITLNKLASTLNTNRNGLSKLINSTFQQNFNGLINFYRVNEARKMLTDPDYHNYTVEAISEMSGFKSKSAFHKAFKEVTGITPSQLKKQNANT